jgi:hypothetical protein
MKKLCGVILLYFTFLLIVSGQSTVFVYDQQSSTETSTIEGTYSTLNLGTLGQTFTPSLSGVGFVRVILGGFGSPIYSQTFTMTLRSGSPTGTVLATSMPLTLFSTNLYANFTFSNNVPVTPGNVYYFELPVARNWQLYESSGFNYSGGSSFAGGVVLNSSFDLWFREGILVPAPEPGTLGLGLLGVGAFGIVRQWQKRKAKGS